ncbi:DUF3095 family protein [Mucilaginibacter ginsenosidivorax]|uniref:DUF3095 domain-containing protein n=1 Tax=Mucilaginibacter ginsenosidivorax TaxID=862126 RepID=A0A5B8W5R7_9SPHI|nr:DUF3095 family protein [Mucilaginibacter ginsenosidivorax]QEC78286.1 DUF3095 domain-containing protein [Mucilaginibacter ginsenosidivorax]
MSANQHQFYGSLPVNNIPLGDLFIREDLFRDVPDDWHVIITDIKGSTLAVLAGGSQNVNLIATGSIVAVLNIALKANVSVPFFFGGDGATFLVPPIILDEAMQALILYRKNTLTNFQIDLRTGTLPVKQVYDQGYKLRIAKHRISEVFSIPVVLGNGLSYAEKIIKGHDMLPNYEALLKEVDLTGMQCRWDKIAPPENTNEVLSLLVIASHEDGQPEVFRKVMCHIDEVYGDEKKRTPISVAQLKLKTTFNRIGTEMRASMGRAPFFEQVIAWFINLYGLIFFSTSKGKHYLEKLVEMSDTLVIDGKINTVISGTLSQRKRLQNVLDKMETDGELCYGLYVSGESVMSCYVRDLDDGHIHFVDGAEGGYTRAAKIIKAKLKR